jgi:hypothetical protein
MPVQKSAWYISVLLFNVNISSKLTMPYKLKSLLHVAGKILDKPILNQEKVLDDVIIFKCNSEVSKIEAVSSDTSMPGI